jgi:hypothetical protein
MKASILPALNTLISTTAPIFALWHSVTASGLSVSAEEFTAFLQGFAAAVPLLLVAFGKAHHSNLSGGSS